MSSGMWRFVAIFFIVNVLMDCHGELVGTIKLFIELSDFMLPASVLP
jgi:hypothetical protein